MLKAMPHKSQEKSSVDEEIVVKGVQGKKKKVIHINSP
jgi:hypothetical protein